MTQLLTKPAKLERRQGRRRRRGRQEEEEWGGGEATGISMCTTGDRWEKKLTGHSLPMMMKGFTHECTG